MKGMAVHDQAPTMGLQLGFHRFREPSMMGIVIPLQQALPFICCDPPQKITGRCFCVGSAHAYYGHGFLLIVPEPLRIADQAAYRKDDSIITGEELVAVSVRHFEQLVIQVLKAEA